MSAHVQQLPLAGLEIFFPTVKIPQADGSVLLRPGKGVVLDQGDWISTAQAARILGLSQRRVEDIIDEGGLREHEDWYRVGERGNYKLRRAAVLGLRGLTDTGQSRLL